jgi:acetyl-CoA synthetase
LSGADEFIKARDLLLHAEDYRHAKEGFAWPRPVQFNWASDYFDTLAEKHSHPALVYVDDTGLIRKVSFQELRDRSNKVANFFVDKGFSKGSRIMLMLHNSVELFESFLGVIKAGCVVIPASTLLTPDDLKDRIIRGKVSCILAHAEFSGRIDAAASRQNSSIVKVSVGGATGDWVDYSDISSRPANFRKQTDFSLQDELLIYFTSGTTAKPKLVLHTHGSYPIGHLTTMYWIGLRPRDTHYNISAPGWAKHAYSTIFGVWNAEATSFVYNYSGKFDAKKVLKILEEHEVTTLCAPPTAWRFLLLEDMRSYTFSLRELVSAGEPLNPEIIQKVQSATRLRIREGYGQTETALQIGVFPGMDVKPGSMGVEAPGFNISIVNDEHLPVDPGTEGPIAVKVKPSRPMGLMAGYIDPPERNLDVFVGDWYLTGDVAYKDKGGCFWFIGRADDVFKSSDYRIGSFELESELLAHPAVTEVAIVASPDPLRGFVPKAFVMLRPGLVPSKSVAIELYRFIREKIAPYRRPRIIEFVPELPKTISGKIRRADLRKYEQELRDKSTRAENEYREADLLHELVVRKNYSKGS